MGASALVTTIHVVDPEVHPDELSRLPDGCSVVTFYNSIQQQVVAGRAHALRTMPRSYAEIRAAFDWLHDIIVDARNAHLAHTQITALESHVVDLAAVLEVGFAPEIHFSIADHLEKLSVSRVEVLACRPIFAEAMRIWAKPRGVEVGVTMLSPEQTPPRRDVRGTVKTVGRMAADWTTRRPRILGSAHRQTVPVLAELTTMGAAAATPALAAAVGVGTRKIAGVTAQELDQARRAAKRLRSYGARRLDGVARTAWTSLMDMFDERLPQTLHRLSAQLLNLDVLRPDFAIAPAWGGIDAHVYRAWCWTYGVPFAVVQHGFNIGARSCTRTRSVDADVFYAWSQRFVDDWMDPANNPEVDVAALGNPAYVAPHLRAPGKPIRTVMLAPAGVLEFGRESLLEYWQAAFATVESMADTSLQFTLRPHAHGRNNDWIRRRGDELGCKWSRDDAPDLDSALREVDVLVTMFSSIAIDAMLRRILVVCTNHLGEPPLFLPDSVGAYTTDSADLPRIVRTMCASEDARARAFARQESLSKAYPTRGNAAAVARDVLQRLASS